MEWYTSVRNEQAHQWMYTVGTLHDFKLWTKCTSTVLGMSKKRTEATLPVHHASLILVTMRWIASVVHLPGCPPNCMGGRRPFFLAMKDRSLAIRVKKSLPKVSSSLIGQKAFVILYAALLGLHRMIVSIVSHHCGYSPSSRIAL